MNKLCVITGATSGIGYEVMAQILNLEVDVIAIGRSVDKLNQLKETFKSKIQAKQLTLVRGDLSEKKGCFDVYHQVSKLINERHQKLDLLINVAGIVNSGYKENSDYNEITFATNHLSVYMLTGLLYPYLKKSSDPRVLVVSSLSHYRACFDKTNLQSKRFYNVLRGYQRSKLYNVLFVKRFNRFEKDIKIYAIDPGLVKTEIGDKHTKGLALIIWKFRKKGGVEATIPAKYMVDIATKHGYEALSGGYMKDGLSIKSSKVTYDIKKQDILWKESQRLTGVIYPFDEVSFEKS